MKRDHGAGARGLNCDAWPLQIQFVGNPRAEKILVVADEGGDVFLGEAAAEPDIHEIGVHGRSREHADAAAIPVRIAAGMLERFMSQLQ